MPILSRGPFFAGPQPDGDRKESATGNPEAAGAACPDGSAEKDGGVWIHEISKQMITDCEPVPATNGIAGGVVCTGFIDVEKVIYPGYCKPPVFLEKKLPFQILLLTLDN